MKSMGQQTSYSRHDISAILKNSLDDNTDYIGVALWKDLNDAYESIDVAAVDLQDELDTANNRITELEERIQELEESA
jgi:predicted  nucleic acid-binding Zn-ribbon protein